MLERSGMQLDGVIELGVDEKALLTRMAKRVADTLAAGGKVRADDNPEAFKTRLDAYRAQTAPVSDYYRRRGQLKSVDGMAPIDEVTREIERVLA
jgi:adenylate kinase